MHAGIHIDNLFLDTTYGDAKYVFPAQEETVEFIARTIAHELEMSKGGPCRASCLEVRMLVLTLLSSRPDIDPCGHLQHRQGEDSAACSRADGLQDCKGLRAHCHILSRLVTFYHLLHRFVTACHVSSRLVMLTVCRK